MPARERPERPGRESVKSPSRSLAPSPGRMSPEMTLALQRTMGNAAVSRLISREEPVQEEAPVQRSAVESVLSSPGTPLADSVRTDMEARLGADFSGVRLHTGPAARDSAAEIGARAYTSGDHVVIGDGGADSHTLAHELTHVIQQRQGPVAGTDNGSGLSISDPSDRFEREAEANAHRARSSPAPVQRDPEDPAARMGSEPVWALQRSVGNAAVSRLLDSGQIAVQRAEWDVKEPLKAVEDEFVGSLKEKDVELLNEAVGRIQEAMQKAKGAGKPVLLYIGVGTGNPRTDWGNPTNEPKKEITEQDQSSPKFLEEADEEYFVIAVNFNTGPDGMRERGSDGGIRLDVPARFPLTQASGQASGAGAAMEKLDAAVKGADRFAVMNAVTQNDYENLLRLYRSRKQNSAYLKSYMASGEAEARNRAGRKDLVSRGTRNKFTAMKDVYADIE